MKYLIKTAEEQQWTIWYVAEADSADEAEEMVKNGEWDKAYEIDGEYDETTYREIVEIEPYNEDI